MVVSLRVVDSRIPSSTDVETRRQMARVGERWKRISLRGVWSLVVSEICASWMVSERKGKMRLACLNACRIGLRLCLSR